MKIFSKKIFVIAVIFLLSGKVFAGFSFEENTNAYDQYFFYFSHHEKLFYNPFYKPTVIDENYFGVVLGPKVTSDFNPFSFFHNYSTPPQPFFCALECKNQQRFNIWIKFRAGTDADYEKSIRTYRQFDYH